MSAWRPRPATKPKPPRPCKTASTAFPCPLNWLLWAEAVMELTYEKKCGQASATLNRPITTGHMRASMDNRREKFPIFLSQGLLLLGFGIAAALNWPGQMSYDSVVQLADGRSGQYDSWHPPVMAWLLGLFDSVLAGPGLFFAFTALLLFGAWLVILRQGRTSWKSAIVLILIFLTPQLLLYQGEIWKDVLFANAGIAAFAGLAGAASSWNAPWTRFIFLSLSVALLSLAVLARQNGFLLLPVAAICLGMIAARQQTARAGWRYGGGLLLASLALIVCANFALGFRTDHGKGAADQLRLAQSYDLVGAIR